MTPKKTVATNSDALSLAYAVVNGVRNLPRLVFRTLLVALCALLLNACESSTPANASTIDADDRKERLSELSVTIEVEHISGAILLTAELKNSSDQELQFLPWSTPFEGAVTADFLRVTEVGSSESVAYTGIMVKRIPPSVEDYTIVKPGSSLKQIVDISKSYNFCASTQYRLAYSGTLVSPNGETYSVQSNTVNLFVSDDFKPCL